MIKKLVSHLGEYKRAAVLTPLFAALEAVMDVLLPTIMAFIIDQGIEKGDMNAILKYGLLTFLVAVVALALGVLAGKYAAEASTGFAGNLRDAMYENIQHYSFSNIDKFSTAGLVTRMTTDVTNVQNAFQMIERMCVRAPVHLVFALFMAVMIGGPLSLIFVVAVVFLVAVLAGIMVPTFHIFDRVFKNYDALNASVQENVSAIRVVKSFVREGFENEKYTKACRHDQWRGRKTHDAFDGIFEQAPEIPFCLACHTFHIFIIEPFCAESYPAENAFAEAVILTHAQHGIHHFSAHQSKIPGTIYNFSIRHFVDDLIKFMSKPAAYRWFALPGRAAGSCTVIFAGQQRIQHVRQK